MKWSSGRSCCQQFNSSNNEKNGCQRDALVKVKFQMLWSIKDQCQNWTKSQFWNSISFILNYVLDHVGHPFNSNVQLLVYTRRDQTHNWLISNQQISANITFPWLLSKSAKEPVKSIGMLNVQANGTQLLIIKKYTAEQNSPMRSWGIRRTSYQGIQIPPDSRAFSHRESWYQSV